MQLGSEKTNERSEQSEQGGASERANRRASGPIHWTHCRVGDVDVDENVGAGGGLPVSATPRRRGGILAGAVVLALLGAVLSFAARPIAGAAVVPRRCTTTTAGAPRRSRA